MSSVNNIAIVHTNAYPLQEPGNMATAFDLSPYYNAGITKTFIITGTVDGNDHFDYFKFSFEKDMIGTLFLTNFLDGDVDLGLYEYAHTAIKYEYSSGNGDVYMDTDFAGNALLFQAGKNYYAEVHSYDKKNSGYVLLIDFDAPIEVIDSNQAFSPGGQPIGEPGDRIPYAFDLSPHYTQGVTEAFDITGTLDGNDYNDYFKFSFDQDMTGILFLTNLDADVDLALYRGFNNRHAETINYAWKWGNKDLHIETDFDGRQLVFKAGEDYYARLYSYDRLPTNYNLFIEFDPIA